MDDFSKIFFKGEDGVPMVKTYDEAEVFNTLNSVAAYDWAQFFHERLRSLAPHAPMGGLERAGWRLTYSAVRSGSGPRSLTAPAPMRNLLPP